MRATSAPYYGVTSGDGSFSDATILTPIYTPGPNDILAGTVTLTLTANGNGSCPPASDNITIVINPAPQTFNVIGGGSFCSNNPAPVSIALDGSEVGFMYDLIFNGVSVIETLTGTGNLLLFSPQSAAGTYTVVSTNPVTSCTALQNGAAVINVVSVPNLVLTQNPAPGLCPGVDITIEAISGFDTYEFTDVISGTVLQAASPVHDIY